MGLYFLVRQAIVKLLKLSQLASRYLYICKVHNTHPSSLMSVARENFFKKRRFFKGFSF